MEGNGSFIICPACRNKIPANSKFCQVCGAKFAPHQNVNPQQQQQQQQQYQQQQYQQQQYQQRQYQQPQYQQQQYQQPQYQQQTGGSSGFKSIVNKANAMVGGQGEVNLNLSDLFSNVFKSHTKEEQEFLFICGTKQTTPPESRISSQWPKPWLFSRVFGLLALTYILLIIMAEGFTNDNAVPGLIFIGSLAVPFSTLIFFFEVNAPRNISIFEVVKIFFVGGLLSLIASCILFEFVDVQELDYTGAILVALVEEIGKFVAVYIFIKRINPKYILNGLLIGAAVGAGFAVFESAGYAFTWLLNFGWESMKETIYIRAILAIGGHVVWAAISGAAIVMVKGSKPLNADAIKNPRFLQSFAIPIVLHAVWDMPIPQIGVVPLHMIILSILAWIIIFAYISNGLKQISNNRNNRPTQMG